MTAQAERLAATLSDRYRALPGNPSQLVVVLNWFEELKAKAGH